MSSTPLDPPPPSYASVARWLFAHGVRKLTLQPLDYGLHLHMDFHGRILKYHIPLTPNPQLPLGFDHDERPDDSFPSTTLDAERPLPNAPTGTTTP
jgi:hypothetical protein